MKKISISFFFSIVVFAIMIELASIVVSSSSSSTFPPRIQLPSKWYYLGPFLYGKTEYDGDPLTFYGGLDKFFPASSSASSSGNSRINSKAIKNKKILSEAAPGGFVKWKTIMMQQASVYHVQLIVQHQELADLQQHLSQDSSALEFIGYAVTIISVPADGVYIFECAAFHTLFFDDVPYSGDQFGRNYRTSVFLKKGLVRLSFKLRGTRAQASVQLKSIEIPKQNVENNNKPLLHLQKHPFSPDLVCSSTSCNFYLENSLTHAAIVIQSHYSDKTIKGIEIRQEEQQQSTTTKQPSFTSSFEKRDQVEKEIRDDPEISSSPSHDVLCRVKRDHHHLHNRDTPTISIPPLHTRTITFPLELLEKEDQIALRKEECNFEKKNTKQEPEVTVRFKVFGYLSSSSEDEGVKEEDNNVAVMTELAAFMLKFRCRKLESQSFLITYRDFDGAPAQSGMILPLNFLNNNNENNKVPTTTKSSSSSSSSFPIVLSLHGTGSSPTSQADAYKYKPTNAPKDSDYFFGIENAFVLTPDRHGAHNWEGVGKLSALHAAFLVNANARRSTSTMTMMMVPDCRRILATGSSMGGHGTLILASQHPHLIIGVALQAPWISKEHYGDSNKIFHLDRSTDFVVPGSKRKMVLEASIADQSLQLENLAHVPILIRTGSADQTVSPFFARKLVRILREHVGHTNVTYDEPRGKPHWWWDTKKPNDGGCVNDGFMRKFYQQVLSLESSSTGEHKVMKMKKFVTHSSFTSSFVNDISSSNHHQQPTPMQRSELMLVKSDNSNEINLNLLMIHQTEEETTNQQQLKKKKKKKPFGPIRQYMEAAFAVGYYHHHQQLLDPFAKFIADTSRVAFDSDAPVVSIMFSSSGERFSRRMILLVSLDLIPQEEDSSLLELISSSLDFPFKFEVTKNSITFGGNDTTITKKGGENLVLVSVFPRSEKFENGGVLVFAQTMKAMKHAINDISMPTVPPMMRPAFGNFLPDFFISDADTAHTGYNSFVRGGYFNELDFSISEEMNF